MATTDILTALVAKLDTFGALPVAWPGIPMEPPSSGMWLEARYFPNKPKSLSWDTQSHQDTRGFFQVSVYYRPGTNSGQNSQLAASVVADQIIDFFPPGLALDAVIVHERPYQSPAVDLEGKSFIPVTIPYRGIVSTVPDSTYYVTNGGVNVTNGGEQVTYTP